MWLLWKIKYALCLYNEYDLTWAESYELAGVAVNEYSKDWDVDELDPAYTAREDMSYWDGD